MLKRFTGFGVFAPLWAFVLLAITAVSAQTQEKPKGDFVSFQKQVAPIFRSSCIGCHSDKTSMGGLSLVSYAKTIKGGKGGAQLVPGKSAESRLVKYILGTALPKMPIGGSLKPIEIDLIKRWIDQGARIDPSLPDTVAPLPIAMPMLDVPAPVHALLFSPDNKSLVVGTYQQVQFFNLATHARERVWAGHQDAVRTLTFTKDGKRLVAGGGSPGTGGEIRVLNLETGKTDLTLGEHSDIVNGVAVTPDDKKLISASTDKSIRIWDLATGKLLSNLRDHADAVFSLSISPDGKYMTSSSADRSVKVWDVAAARRLYSLSAHEDWIYSVTLSPDGKRFVSTSADGSAKLWNFGTSDSGTVFGIRHEGAVLASAFSPDSQRFATASADKLVKLWKLDGNNFQTFKDAKDWVYSVCFSPNGKWLAGGTWDGSILLWNIETGKLETVLSTRNSKPTASIPAK